MKKFAIAAVILLAVIGIIIFFAMRHNGANSTDQPLSQAMIDSGIKIIDIRTQPEWELTGIVPGAYTITFLMREAAITYPLSQKS